MIRLAGAAFFATEIDGPWHVVEGQGRLVYVYGYSLCGIAPASGATRWPVVAQEVESSALICPACYLIAVDLELLQ